ncbi:hypothetical protein ABZ354_19130 [Streptomyces sp. NPDC005925]|uniref:hypothetical protein n=1 Tax=Streptomyces sp. NPDC005925 TaxID=3157172 RepID=UPI0033C7260E
MTSIPTEGNHPPIYEHLIRELGDAVAEAQRAAAHTQHKAAQLLGPRHPPHANAAQAPHRHR